MKFSYITIEREYGSGGTKIARELAKECGINCYGREILESVSKELRVPVEQVEKYEETVSNSFLYTVFVMSRAQTGNADMVNKEGHIYLAEQAKIKQLSAKGPAVFLGHCASEALKDKRNLVKVFIRCSDETIKKERIIQEYNINEANVNNIRKKFDSKRANYYYANTTKRWENLSNYDIVLDSAKLGIEGCIASLKALLS